GLALLGTISTNAIKDKFAELAPGLQKAAESGQSPDQIKQLQGQFTALATTHGFTRAFIWSAFLALGAGLITLVGLSIKHKDLAQPSTACIRALPTPLPRPSGATHIDTSSASLPTRNPPAIPAGVPSRLAITW